MEKITQPSLIDAVLSLVPGAIVQITEESADGITWGEEHTLETPTFEEIQFEYKRLLSEFDSLEYARLRKAEYDKLNQDEMRFDDLVNGTTTWQDAIQAVKDAHPKS